MLHVVICDPEWENQANVHNYTYLAPLFFLCSVNISSLSSANFVRLFAVLLIEIPSEYQLANQLSL